MNILAAYGDVGPEEMIGKTLVPLARERGHNVTILPTSAAKDMPDVGGVRAAVLGFSSVPRDIEHALIDALRAAGIPWVIAEDAPGSSQRPWMKTHAPEAALALTASPLTESAARQYGYPNVRHVGVPPHWKGLAEGMRNATAIRERIGITRGNLHGIVLGKRPLLTIVGVKNQPEKMTAAMLAVRDAALQIFGDTNRFALMFRGHPRELLDTERMKALQAERTKLLQESGVWAVENPQEHDLGVYIGASQLTFFPTETSTASSVAPYFEKTTALVPGDTLQKQVTDMPADVYPPYLGNGLIDPSRALVEQLQHLLGKGGEELRVRQAAHFPAPPTWDTASAWLDAVEQVARGS